MRKLEEKEQSDFKGSGLEWKFSTRRFIINTISLLQKAFREKGQDSTTFFRRFGNARIFRNSSWSLSKLKYVFSTVLQLVYFNTRPTTRGYFYPALSKCLRKHSYFKLKCNFANNSSTQRTFCLYAYVS